ncbi:cotranscriptional regulator ARB2A-like isoform X2 [Littorina saxatilis]
MELLRSAWAKLKGVLGQRGEDMPRYTFPDTLEEFGYHFNEKGELVNEDGGGFQFVVKEGDRNYNQQHYDALGELVTEYLYNIMEKELQLEKIYIPVDAKREEPQSFIFKSKDALVSDKLMVLIHGSGAVRAGQWSRKLIINENIDTGSQLPYIRRAMDDGYGVIVLNPNLNEVTVNGRPVKIRESKSPEEHGVNVWQNFVLTAKASSIVIVAHSFGGIVTCHMAEKFLEEFLQRVFCVVFTDSVHSADRGRWSQPVKDFMQKRAVNFASAYVPLDTMLDASSPDDCLSVSAGTKEHERTSHACIDSAFKFIRDNFDTWIIDGSMAPRDFLPLPENLEDFSPARQWEAKVKKEEEKMKKEGDEKMIKEEDENMKKEEEAAKNGEEESESKNGGAPGSGEDPRETQKNLKDGEKDRDIKAEEDQAKQPAKESSEGGQGEGNAEGEKAESTSSQQGNESTSSQQGNESTSSQQGNESTSSQQGNESTSSQQGNESTSSQQGNESTSSQQGNESTASQNKVESTEGEQYSGEQKEESAAGEPEKKITGDEEKQKQPEVPKSEL